MRYYLEEKLDDSSEAIREYIISIKDFSISALVDEIYKNFKNLNDAAYERNINDHTIYYNNPVWIKDFKDYYSKENTVSLIASAIEEKYYIFNDKDEHNVNIQYVNAIIGDGPSFIHRWKRTEYK